MSSVKSNLSTTSNWIFCHHDFKFFTGIQSKVFIHTAVFSKEKLRDIGAVPPIRIESNGYIIVIVIAGCNPFKQLILLFAKVFIVLSQVKSLYLIDLNSCG